PLYLNGTISSYTCGGLNRREGPIMPLVSTLFVDVGHAAIRGEFVQGLEDEAVYRYYQGEKNVRGIERQFDQLKQMSEPLLQVSTNSCKIHEHVLAMFREVADSSHENSILRDIFVSIPLYLIPAAALTDIMDYNDLPERQRRILIDKHRTSREALRNVLDRGQLLLSFPRKWLPLKDASQDSGTVTEADVCWNEVGGGEVPKLESGLQDIGTLNLSREQYRSWLLSLRRLLLDFPRLILRPIVDNPFGHLRILFLRGNKLLVIRRQPMGLMLECTQAAICHNFAQYFYKI
ncbi:MAG TPA: hypothetical protein GX717_07115, partial [Clostridiaceae bacterium]|nr:hypothetical protein [Clostridiaceae bacterium]